MSSPSLPEKAASRISEIEAILQKNFGGLTLSSSPRNKQPPQAETSTASKDSHSSPAPSMLPSATINTRAQAIVDGKAGVCYSSAMPLEPSPKFELPAALKTVGPPVSKAMTPPEPQRTQPQGMTRMRSNTVLWAPKTSLPPEPEGMLPPDHHTPPSPETVKSASPKLPLAIMPPPSKQASDADANPELASMQFAWLKILIDMEKPPYDLSVLVEKTRIAQPTVAAATRYAHARLNEAHARVNAIEAELWSLGVMNHGHGRQLEDQCIEKRAEHVGDEAWIASSKVRELKWECEYAAKERQVMEWVGNNLQGVLDMKKSLDLWKAEGRIKVYDGPIPRVLPKQQRRRQQDPKTNNPNDTNRGSQRSRGGGTRGRGGRIVAEGYAKFNPRWLSLMTPERQEKYLLEHGQHPSQQSGNTGTALATVRGSSERGGSYASRSGRGGGANRGRGAGGGSKRDGSWFW